MPEAFGIGALIETLEGDERLQDVDVIVAGLVLEVHRGDALVVIGPPDANLSSYLERLADRRAGLLLVGDGAASLLGRLSHEVIAALLPGTLDRDAVYLAIDGLLDRVSLHKSDARMSVSLDRYRYELGELVDIGQALSQERDIDRLLDLILVKSRYVTGADAGSIYVLEGDAPEIEQRQLRFKLSQNDSCDFESSEFTMPVSTRSIAGYAAVTRRPIAIPDVDTIADDAPYGFDESFDKRVGYRTRSMMTVPMISAEGEVIGVIQLINKKVAPSKRLETKLHFDTGVIPFDERSSEMLATLASQAGIALENALLYDEIRSIFEGFVRASVQAIEQRDPTTSGHSLRVSVLSCRLAEVVDRADGLFRDIHFTRRELKELEYASLLHDFGKIGVREEVLVKAKKLYPHQLQAIQQRVWYATKAAEVDALRKKVERMAAGAGKGDLDALDEQLAARRREFETAWATISEANEPTVLSEGDFTRIAELAELAYIDGAGDRRMLLSEQEVQSLQVRRGSLNTGEMDEIRSHVVHTKNFLTRIPWGKSFSRIPEIAGAHHEKLDGSGYPLGIEATAIPVQSKIMTIADIYDALTARDRPYKKAVPVQRALDILGFEVKGGHIDPELVRIFAESETFKEVDRELEY